MKDDMSFGSAIRTQYVSKERTLPLALFPVVPWTYLTELTVWIQQNREVVNAELLRHGALLFRDFPVETATDFEGFAAAASDAVIEYGERSSPRTPVANRIYTSTDYPPSQRIFPHNELSYSLTYPLNLFFCCLKPAAHGGETPLVDIRRVTQRISPQVKDRFREMQWMYVRNFGDGLGLSWQAAFQTTEKSAVESYCREQKLDFEWKSGNRLRTWQIRPAFVQHPRTGEWLWFNHATFFHVSTLDRTLREVITAEFADDELPNNTYYGNGSPIEESVLEELRSIYQQEMVRFSWRKGDVLMLDNVLTAHGRASYIGTRSVVVAMAEPITRKDV
jgi:alpha-ketoglutarate-dependent taurine dioxygenase